MAISTPGVGSGLDVNSIVTKLMAVESQPLTVLQKKEAGLQAKLSAYGTIQGALSSFQSAVSSLSDISKFQTFSATATDSSVLSASASSLATPGSYAITVNSLAQAQSLSTAGQVSTSTGIGSGASTTLSFQLGTISGATPAAGRYTGATFTPDASQATGTVVIDSTNNSLQGIRDAINAAHIGATASLVNDGDPTAPYHLLLTSNTTGLAKSLKITASGGDAAIGNLLAYDPAGTQNLSQTSAAQNASLNVNGLPISSATNAVSGAIPGVTLNLTKGGGASSNVSIANNTAAVATAVQALVTSYNSVNSTVSKLTGYDSKTKTAGLLLGDTATQNIQARLRSTLGSALSGTGNTSLSNVAQVGISFLKDGSLALDNAKLQTALTTSFSDVGTLFASVGKSTDSLINYAGATTSSRAGSYAVQITQIATRGSVVGSTTATQANLDGSIAAGLTIDGTNDQLSVAVDGAAPLTVSLTPGAPYASAAALATQVQTDINAALATAGQTGTVTVTQSGGKLSIRSNTFGASSAIAVTNGANPGAANLFGSPTPSSVSTITAEVNDKLSISVNGVAGTVTLQPGTYSASTLATQLQSAINGTSAFALAGVTVNATQNAGILSLSAGSYGASSVVQVTGGTAKNNLFGALPVASAGVNVAGTINGVAAVGLGQSLTGATGDKSEGIRLQVAGGSTGARGTINYSQGYAYNLQAVVSNFLAANTGSVATSTDSANRSIADLRKQADGLNVRLTATEKRYRAQFTALDTLVSKLATTSSFLSQQLANLPKSS